MNGLNRMVCGLEARSPARALGSGEIHVWSALADSSEAPSVGLDEGVLTDDERVRADRFVFDRDRVRFVAGRAFLRRILAAYLELEPSAVRLSYGPHGKPVLAWATFDLRFNVSNADGLVVCALARGCDLGVDVERVRSLPDATGVAKAFFTGRENHDLSTLTGRAYMRGFFDCWTRKEAFLKATGDGLSRPLDSFDVCAAPGELARIRRVDGDPDEAERWSLIALEPHPGFVAAVAIRGSGWRLRIARGPQRQTQ